MISDARNEIGKYVELDVECEDCGSVFTIARPGEAACNRLIDGRYYKQAFDELELLNRAADVFDAHPLSNHRYVILKKYRDRVANPEDDSLLQEAVDADPPLRKFLSGSIFSFHHRKRGVQNSMTRLLDALGSHTTPCPQCGRSLRLTDESLDACQGIFWNEETRLRWIQRRVE